MPKDDVFTTKPTMIAKTTNGPTGTRFVPFVTLTRQTLFFLRKSGALVSPKRQDRDHSAAFWLRLGRAVIFEAFVVGILTVVFCISVASTASATVLLPADFTMVVDGAGLIVHGRVVEVRSTLAGPRRTIESLVTIAVIQSLKGAPGPTVTFSVPNGQVGRYRRILVGAPEFEREDEVIVFLQGRPPAVPMLFGLSQGVYRVRRDDSARPLVTPPPVMARGIAAERVVRGDPVRQPMPVEDFVGAVKAVLERSR